MRDNRKQKTGLPSPVSHPERKMNPSKRNLYILTFTLFVVMLGYGIVIPILPFYIESMDAGGTELGLLTASYAVMRLIFGPIWGSLSDRVGRKPICSSVFLATW